MLIKKTIFNKQFIKYSFLFYCLTFFMLQYIVGIKRRVTKVPMNKPPITTIAIGCINLPPAPRPKESGIKAKIVVRVVIKIGLNRCVHPYPHQHNNANKGNNI